MAIFIENKSTCKICNKQIFRTGDIIGFPFVDYAYLSDTIVHRKCIIGDQQYKQIVKVWSNFWKNQAKVFDQNALIDENKVVFKKSEKFVYIFFPAFIEIEESINDLMAFSDFLNGIRKGEKENISLDLNNYEIDWTKNYPEFTVVTYPKKIIIEEDKPHMKEEILELVHHSFSIADWQLFIEMK